MSTYAFDKAKEIILKRLKEGDEVAGTYATLGIQTKDMLERSEQTSIPPYLSTHDLYLDYINGLTTMGTINFYLSDYLISYASKEELPSYLPFKPLMVRMVYVAMEWRLVLGILIKHPLIKLTQEECYQLKEIIFNHRDLIPNEDRSVEAFAFNQAIFSMLEQMNIYIISNKVGGDMLHTANYWYWERTVEGMSDIVNRNENNQEPSLNPSVGTIFKSLIKLI